MSVIIDAGANLSALSAHMGISEAARTLVAIDEFYADLRGTTEASADRVSSQLVRQLGNPRPKDQKSIKEIAHYKGIRRSGLDQGTFARRIGTSYALEHVPDRTDHAICRCDRPLGAGGRKRLTPSCP